MTERLSEIEKRVVGALEAGLAPVARPYLEVARAASTTPEEVIAALKSLAARGIVRRAAAILSAGAVGVGGAALVAWRVSRRRLEETALALSEKNFVTHCVARKKRPEWPYNLYTMLHGKDECSVRKAVREMADEFGITEYVVLETREELKRTPPKYHFEGPETARG